MRNEIKEEEVGGAHVTYGSVTNAYNILFGKAYQKKLLGRSGYRWVGNSEANFETYRVYVCGLACFYQDNDNSVQNRKYSDRLVSFCNSFNLQLFLLMLAKNPICQCCFFSFSKLVYVSLSGITRAVIWVMTMTESSNIVLK
jgi:hypothetical protein